MEYHTISLKRLISQKFQKSSNETISVWNNATIPVDNPDGCKISVVVHTLMVIYQELLKICPGKSDINKNKSSHFSYILHKYIMICAQMCEHCMLVADQNWEVTDQLTHLVKTWSKVSRYLKLPSEWNNTTNNYTYVFSC